MDVREAAGRRSFTGPGKPYWKMPLGSTRALRAAALGEGMAGTEETGRGGPVTVVVVVVTVGRGDSFFVESRAAVAAAPAAAPPAAMIANVTFDMVVDVASSRTSLLHQTVQSKPLMDCTLSKVIRNISGANIFSASLTTASSP